MTNETTTDNERTGEQTDTDTERSETADDGSIEAVRAENRELRERVDQLEATLSDIVDVFDGKQPDEESEDVTQTGEDADGPVLVTAGGQVFKVIGELDDDGGVGVYGHNTASSGTTYGVVGETESSDSGSIGVQGHASAANATGATYGVEGRSDADGSISTGGPNPIGVRGVANGSGITYGAVGESTSKGGTGVLGAMTAATKEYESFFANGFVEGVAGYTDRSPNETGITEVSAVAGYATATSGETYGVYGEASSPDGYGLYTLDDAKVESDMEVGGSLSVGQTGASVYMSSSQSTPGNFSANIVEFDTEVADDGNNFDTSNHEFTCPRDGDYFVETQIQWSQLTEDTEYNLSILVDGNDRARSNPKTPSSAGTTDNVVHQVSKVLKGLSSGDVISVQAGQWTGDSVNIESGQDTSYLTITQLG